MIWMKRHDHVNYALSVLLALQALTLFVVIPLGSVHPAFHVLLDVCHLAFATICVTVLTRNVIVRAGLILSLAVLAAGPIAAQHLLLALGVDTNAQHEVIALTAFAFNGAVTALVARHVFGPGRVTAHRVRGAVLLYLNAASLFAIAYGALEAHVPGAIVATRGAAANVGAQGNGALTYFSLSTLTTTGYGDLVPVHPLARSLANLESVFGSLFPATLLARIVALQLAHDTDGTSVTPPGPSGPPVVPGKVDRTDSHEGAASLS